MKAKDFFKKLDSELKTSANIPALVFDYLTRPIKPMRCALCSTACKCRQWGNRGKGLGLCSKCASDGLGVHSVHYGLEGIHYNPLKLEAMKIEGDGGEWFNLSALDASSKLLWGGVEVCRKESGELVDVDFQPLEGSFLAFARYAIQRVGLDALGGVDVLAKQSETISDCENDLIEAYTDANHHTEAAIIECLKGYRYKAVLELAKLALIHEKQKHLTYEQTQARRAIVKGEIDTLPEFETGAQ